MKTKLIKVKAKTIFTKSKLGVEWAINPYVGCQHACLYCYAKFIKKWRPASYGKWGTWVEAKTNAPEIVKGKYVKGWVYMSSICDPYQPVEKELKLTRRILENMDKRIKLIVQTKSNLVLRDIDLFKQFKNIEIGLTINSFRGKTKKLFEPNSPTNTERIKTLQKLKEEDFKTYAFVSPIIPDLINLKDIISKTKQYVDYYWFEFLNLRGAGKEFAQVLKREFPESYKIVVSKDKFGQFVKECRQVISSQNIKVRGIVVH